MKPTSVAFAIAIIAIITTINVCIFLGAMIMLGVLSGLHQPDGVTGWVAALAIWGEITATVIFFTTED